MSILKRILNEAGPTSKSELRLGRTGYASQLRSTGPVSGLNEVVSLGAGHAAVDALREQLFSGETCVRPSHEGRQGNGRQSGAGSPHSKAAYAAPRVDRADGVRVRCSKGQGQTGKVGRAVPCAPLGFGPFSSARRSIHGYCRTTDYDHDHRFADHDHDSTPGHRDRGRRRNRSLLKAHPFISSTLNATSEEKTLAAPLWIWLRPARKISKPKGRAVPCAPFKEQASPTRQLERIRNAAWTVGLACILATGGCVERTTPVEEGNRLQILHKGNGQEPEDLDPHIVTGVPEYNVMAALLEGLVSEDPVTLAPQPASAERWEISADRMTYTFYLRPEARWSNGDPLRAEDFVFSYQRILSPGLGSAYAYMLYCVEHAEAFNKGQVNDFSEVGVEALDERTLQIRLANPTPYFLSLITHWTWLPVHPPTILRHGAMDERGTGWTKPGQFVGNGPFVLDTWKPSQVIVVRKNEQYWDTQTTQLNGIHFYPIGSATTEERAFRAGRLHITYQLPLSKIGVYRETNPNQLRIDPYLATYYYSFNVTRPPFDDVRVRRAFSLAVEREAVVRLLAGGQQPAYHFTPPDTAGYTARARIQTDVTDARALLAEAGYPDGQGFPGIELLYNTSDNHRLIAEALQQMWKKNLGVDVTMVNQEWKVYVNARKMRDFDLCRVGWVGDYQDPNTFLDLWVSEGGNNFAGWTNATYDAQIAAAAKEEDPAARYALFQQAESLLLEELPMIPIYFYTTVYAKRPEVKQWHPTLLDHHPYKYVSLEAAGPE